jgi:Tfp pilus assembly protein PilX
MTTRRILLSRPAPRRGQQGLVLFVALIVLVAMTLAGIGMVRSVDTSAVIAGNLAFKQATIQGGDQGIDAAYQWLIAKGGTAELNNTNPAEGYFSARFSEEPNWSDPDTWTNSKCMNACAADARTGNVVRYVIHRMCTEANTPYNGKGATGADNQCAIYYSTGATPGASKRGDAVVFEGRPSLYYRITSRVEGPRNTLSVVQSTVIIEN